MRATRPRFRWRACVAGALCALSITAPLLAAGVDAAVARNRAAVRAIDSCLPRLDPEADVGRARIAARCPGALEAVDASPIARNLPRDWQQTRNDMSAGSLRALRRALVEPAAPARRALPDAAVLVQISQAARAGMGQGDGSWARFSRWLRSLLERGGPQRGTDGALAGWLRDLSIPQRAWTVIGYAVLAALLLFAAWVVRAELRAAGLLELARARRAVGLGAVAVVRDDAASYASLPLEERPAWLLRRIAAQLQRLGWLQSGAALTARELARRAPLDTPQDRAGLHEVAALAERVRYAPRPPASAEIENALGPARELLQRLEAGAAGEAR